MLDKRVGVCYLMDKSRSVSIRRFKMSDVNSVVRLLELVFKRPFSLEWWNWKYRLNPAGFWVEDGDIWVAESSGEIVSYYAVIPEKIKFGSETITVAQSVDTATHPDFRGRGLLSTLARKVYSECQKRYRFIYGFPSEMAFKGFLRLGWNDFRVVEFVKFLNYDRPLENFSKNTSIVWTGKALLKMLCTLKRISLSVQVKKSTRNFVEFQKVDRFPEEINDFWNKVRLNYKIAVERTATFLNWRFSKNFGNYQIYIGRNTKNGSILGYVVLKKAEYGSKLQNVLDIVDICTLPGEEKLAFNLVDIAVSTAENEGLDLIHCRVPTWHEYVHILSKMGFIALNHIFRLMRKYQPRFILYQFSNQKKTSKIQQSWFYTLADTDYA
jgi:GNAT superfamily N-acetyltransferase